MSNDETTVMNGDSSQVQVSRLSDIEKHQDPSEQYLVDWDGDNDPLDPRTFSAARKWFYVAVVAMGSLLV
jgi:hypothetical protein